MKIRNVQLANGKKVDIIIEGYKIQDIKKALTFEDGIDGTGLIAIPGIIDPHVHFRVPGASHKEDWKTGSVAALSGGVTTVFDMPNTSPPLTTYDRLLEKRKLVCTDKKVNAYFWFGATSDNLDEIVAVSREPDIIGIKVFMGSTTGDLLVTNEKDLYKIFSICADNNLIAGVHAENERLLRINRWLLGRKPKLTDHNYIRDTEVEVFAVMKSLRLAKQTGCRLYLCHLSTPEAVEFAIEAKKSGLPVFIEATPHHFTFDERNLSCTCGAYFKMNPPLRTPRQVARLCEYVCGGSIDTIGSDHAPHTHNEKQNIEYDDIPSGVPGVETLLPILFNLVSEGKMSIEQLVRLTSGNAAKIFNLKSKGKIEKGYDADITLIDPKRKLILHNSAMKTKCGWTPYDKMMVEGTPVITIINGTVVWSL